MWGSANKENGELQSGRVTQSEILGDKSQV